MLESDGPPRRFSDEEVRSILARAAKLQELAPPAPSATDGLTLHDLEQVAEEAGISGALVRRAAAEVDLEAGAAPGGPGVIGGVLGSLWGGLLAAALAVVGSWYRTCLSDGGPAGAPVTRAGNPALNSSP